MAITGVNAAVPPDTSRRPSRWKRRLSLGVGALAVVALLLAVSLRIALRPENAIRLILDKAGDALGLEITATGIGEYRLRGTPQLIVRGVAAREPGAKTALLRAERIAIAVPWSTIRSRGTLLEVQRVELDAPVLDLPALQAWQAKRPPSETRIPTLIDGLAITRGRIDNDDWDIDGIEVQLPRLHPQLPVGGHLRGRYLDAPTRIDFDLDVALTRPANDVGAAAIGDIAIARDDWRLPAWIKLSGPVHLGGDDLRISPARLAMSAVYESGKGADQTRLPFILGLHGPVHFDEATWTLAPVGVVLRGQGVLPTFDARGAIALGRRLVLRLQGQLPQWNGAWPALPPPIGQSASPLPFRLDYVGKPDTSDIAALQLRRDDTRFDGRFRLPEVLQWIGATSGDSPLPPLEGRVTTPRLEVSGAQLEGVEVELDDPTIDSAQ